MARFDIVLFGATSFVGKILTRYMFDTFGVDKDLKWAIAGRSESKLNDLKASLGEQGNGLQVLLADAHDQASIDAVCEATRVVVSTVGPYALYGEPMVKACVSSGTDYCDLTGEPQWIHQMLSRYEAVAKVSGARIIHSCGFDSIPSDLGVFFLQQQAQTSFGKHCNQVKLRVKAMKGAASGGTIASMLNLIKEATKDPKLRRILQNPYALCPQNHPFAARQMNLKGAKFDAEHEHWIAPFVMAAINTRIVHRSNALLNAQYGEDFLYDEAVITGRNTKGGITATGMSIGLGGFMMAAAFPPTRWALEKFILPAPGEGPSESAQQKGFFDIRLYGKTADGQTLTCKVTGDRDPGYGSTAKMLGQAAACIAEDLPKEALPGGFWTPASAMGEKLIKRLIDSSGLTFERLD